MRAEIDLCLPPDLPTVSFARQVAKSLLISCGVSLACTEDISLALSEACANVLRHADTSEDYEVRISVDGSVCDIRVTDQGRGLDPSSFYRPMPEPTDTGGRGIAIIRAIVDSVDCVSVPGRGTTIHCVKNLQFAPALR